MSNTQSIGGSSSSGTGFVETLTSNSGVATAVANNINVLGGDNINTDALGDTLNINLNSVILQPDGTAVAPSYSFTSASGDGIYYEPTGGGNLAIAHGGVEAALFGFSTKLRNIVEHFSGLALTRSDVSSSPYNVTSSQIFLSVDTTSARTINLPTAGLQENQIFIIKDRTGNAGTNNITVTTSGGVVNIDGSTTYVINTNYDSFSFLWNSTSYEVF